MKKFIEYENDILTKRVYLNIKHDEGLVDTLSLETEDALTQYGELDVEYISEPEYFNDSYNVHDNVNNEEEDSRKPGVTNVILIQNNN